jgi:hypothetical protein
VRNILQGAREKCQVEVIMRVHNVQKKVIILNTCYRQLNTWKGKNCSQIMKSLFHPKIPSIPQQIN